MEDYMIGEDEMFEQSFEERLWSGLVTSLRVKVLLGISGGWQPYIRDEDPVLAKKQDPGLCTSNGGTFLKAYRMNI